MSVIQLLLNIHIWVFYNVAVVWTYSNVSCEETLFAYILIAITRNLSGNRSQTPISSYKIYNPRVGVRLQHNPLRVYSEIPMTRMSRGHRNTDRSHSLFVIYHNNPKESERIVQTSVQVCVITLWRATEISTYCQTVTYHLSLRNPPRSLGVNTLWRATTNYYTQ